MNEKRLYFAYGSNINLQQMAFRCPDAKVVKPVDLHDYFLTYCGGGVATVIPKEGAKVQGLMWEITPECEKSLDRYEGYPGYYHKKDVTVTDPETGDEFTVMMYEMDEKYKMPAIPSRAYFDGILKGYLDNNMDPRPLLRSLRKVKEEYRKELNKGWNLFNSYDTPQNQASKKKKHDHER